MQGREEGTWQREPGLWGDSVGGAFLSQSEEFGLFWGHGTQFNGQICILVARSKEVVRALQGGG